MDFPWVKRDAPVRADAFPKGMGSQLQDFDIQWVQSVQDQWVLWAVFLGLQLELTSPSLRRFLQSPLSPSQSFQWVLHALTSSRARGHRIYYLKPVWFRSMLSPFFGALKGNRKWQPILGPFLNQLLKLLQFWIGMLIYCRNSEQGCLLFLHRTGMFIVFFTDLTERYLYIPGCPLFWKFFRFSVWDWQF